MSRNSFQRVAFVKLSPQGKAYAMRCDRKDIVVGDEVEVLMYAGTPREYYDDGEITDISQQRWDCSCHVINHICEVSYKFDTSGLVRTVDHSVTTKTEIDAWRAQKSPYLESLNKSVRSDMQDIYEAIAPEPGEDAYLGDGVWIRADGSTDDRGR